MHTSKALKRSDYRIYQCDGGERNEVSFESFYPDYERTDRVVVVSPMLEDGVVNTGYTLLAITAEFYGSLWKEKEDFYAYPYHFGIFDVNQEGVAIDQTRMPISEDVFGAWSWLDVWPQSQWLHSEGDVVSMLESVFSSQAQCVFWPEDFFLSSEAVRKLPCYVRPLLESRLKCVYLYNSEQPNFEIHVSESVELMVENECRSRFPSRLAGRYSARPSGGDTSHPYMDALRRIEVSEFLQLMDGCFEPDVAGVIKRSGYYADLDE